MKLLGEGSKQVKGCRFFLVYGRVQLWRSLPWFPPAVESLHGFEKWLDILMERRSNKAKFKEHGGQGVFVSIPGRINVFISELVAGSVQLISTVLDGVMLFWTVRCCASGKHL